MSQTHIQEQVDLIARHEAGFLARRTPAERGIDTVAGFAGSLTFVAVHVSFFLAWILWNTAGPRHHRFDSPPFSLLGTAVGLEAILLASLILNRQTRMGRRAEEREHLMLQVLLLAEKETTAVLKMQREVASSLGLERVANRKEIRELSEHISLEDVAQTIKENLVDLEDEAAEPKPDPDAPLSILSPPES